MSTLFELEIASTRTEPGDTLVVELKIPPEQVETFRFQHGQYLTLEADIPLPSGGQQTLRRSYSICSAPGEPLSIAIKRIEDGVFSNFAHHSFKPGGRVLSLPPAGNFTAPIQPDSERRYLCIAAGSGITPVLSIMKTVLREEPQARVTLIYGNRSAAQMIFRESLSWLKNAYLDRFQWINIFSRETQAAPILNGRIDNSKGAQLNQHLIDIAACDEFFLCGPEGMIAEVSRGLRGMGVTDEQIHYELFFASAEDAREALARHRARAQTYSGLTTRVTVRASGRETVFDASADGENILDGAINNGMTLPYSCKGGVCATCKARLLEGQVDMDLNHALSQAEVEAGYILTCQAHPITEHVLVDFDVT